MKRIRREPLSSKGPVKSRTQTKRNDKRLKLNLADTFLLDEATAAHGDPFTVFSEWASEADHRAYDGL